MKCKKILALVLSCVMLLSLLAACDTDKPVDTKPQETQGTNKPTETNAPETTEPKKEITFPLAENIEVSVMATLGNGSYSLNDNICWKYLQERSNITFNTIDFAPSEAAEKQNLMMSSGEYPEVLYKCGKLDLDQYGMDGILIPLEDLIREYCPNLCALLDERNAWAEITAPDGHIYSLPAIGKTGGNGGDPWWINKGWLDKLGLEEPKSVEELYTVLKAFKEQDPNGNGKADEIPVGVYANRNSYSSLLSLFDGGSSYMDYWRVMDGQMEYLPTTEWFKENFLELFNKMYTEGILNPDMFTMDRDQFRAVCGAEEMVYGLIYDSSPQLADKNDCVNWVTLKPFDTDVFALTSGVIKGGLAISDKCKNPEIIMAWADFLYTEEGGRINRLGIEGVNYKINENGTWENIKGALESNVYQGTLMGTVAVPGILTDLYFDNPANDITRHINREIYLEGYGSTNVGVIMPSIKLTEEESEEYSVIFTDISAYVDNYVAECTTGIQDIDASWEKFQATLEQMGVERMIEIYRDAYARAIG